MPDTDDSAEFIVKRPEMWFVPFEENFKNLRNTVADKDYDIVLELRGHHEHLQAPTVRNGDCVKRKGHMHPEPPRVCIATGVDATARFG